MELTLNLNTNNETEMSGTYKNFKLLKTLNILNIEYYSGKKLINEFDIFGRYLYFINIYIK